MRAIDDSPITWLKVLKLLFISLERSPRRNERGMFTTCFCYNLRWLWKLLFPLAVQIPEEIHEKQKSIFIYFTQDIALSFLSS